MKKLLLCTLLLSACKNELPAETIESPEVAETAQVEGPYEGWSGKMVLPYMDVIENPDFDIIAFLNDPDLPLEWDPRVDEAYPTFNPLRLLREEPETIRANLGEEAVSLEDVLELQTMLLELEAPQEGVQMTVAETANLNSVEWQQPYIFFTSLQALKPFDEMIFTATNENSYAYYFYEDYGPSDSKFDPECSGFNEESYTPFILKKTEEGKLESLKTQFDSTAIYCGPGGAAGGTYLDVLVQFDEQGRIHRIFAKHPDSDELVEGPLFADYTFYYATPETHTDYTVRFMAVQYNSNQVQFSHLQYTYAYPFTNEGWYWY